ncbi:MAG TPA: S8 family serine peptidase [Bryobacteraceae bacterium]|nr:S8 family serine peptidase [Bryobacteraceae bacterium]
MQAIVWILLAAMPLLAQTGPRERTSRKVRDKASEPRQTAPDPDAPVAQGPRGSGAFGRYAVVLEQAPVAAAMPTREAMMSAAGRSHRARVAESQAAVHAEVARRGLREFGASDTLVNAVYISARAEDVDALAALPGVRYVRELRPIHKLMTRANDVVRSPAAWSFLGGKSNAGTGVRIAIIDSGIDHMHPSMQDSSLSMPSGFPKCSGSECSYTNTKVIAARSFVDRLIYAYSNDTRPDDASPRDRSGHGTAAASVAAGADIDTPLGRMSGVAPKAYLGNYKVFGTPGVNDFTFDDVIIAALEAALLDGMDVASLSLGGASLWGPNDRGSVCDKGGNTACDLQVEAVENAVRRGLTVVVSAGNSGDAGLEIPSLNTISSPGIAPNAITVGATVNSHVLFQSVRVPGGPAALQRMNAYFGDGPKPSTPLQAVVRDVTKLQNDGKACTSLGNGSLSGTIALIARGNCTFAVKVNNAQQAGAVGVILYQTDSNSIFAPGALSGTAIPLVMIGKDNGVALQQYVNTNPSAVAQLDPAITALDAPADEIAIFSSQGPATGSNGIKPELVAVGADLYMATQKYDPNGELYDPTGFVRGDGTSFSAPMVAGAAALVKQRGPNLTPAQVKSAVVNAANPNIYDYDYDGNRIAAFQSGMGAGQLDVDRAVRANVAADPAAVSFGVVTGLPLSAQVRLVNLSNSPLNLQFHVSEEVRANGVTVSVSPSSANVGVGQTATVTLRVTGSLPSAQWYEGALVVDGGVTQLRIPYSYLVGNNVPFNAIPLTSDGFTALVNGRVSRLNVKFVDAQGVPASGVPVRFRSEVGGGRVDTALAQTDALGIADAVVFAGPSLGEQVFSVEGGGLHVEWVGRAIQQPLIQSSGIVNAASGQLGSGIAPGSYISIFGAALADSTLAYSTPYLPLSLAGISVGFDVPGRQLSYPARLHFVSPGQINVQVPWELAGISAVDMKVSIGDFSSATVRIAVNDYSPAFFEYSDAGSGRLLTAALDANYNLVTAANAVARGQVVQLYANGIGPVDNAPASGEPAGAQPLSSCRSTPEVSIGGRPAPVLFCGLAPGFVGLYQVNVTVPADSPTGIQPLVIRSGGITAKTASLPVR